MNRNFWIVLVAIVVVSGCVGGEPKPMPPEMAERLEKQKEAAAAEKKAVEDALVAKEEAAAAAKKKRIERARAGVGEKGSGYGGDPITEPARAYFLGKDKITFEIEIPKQMRMFKALNDRVPRDAEEFEKEILKPLRIQLPELPEGKEYGYDAKKGELIVITYE